MENTLDVFFLKYIIIQDAHNHDGPNYGLDDNWEKTQRDNGLCRVDHPAAVPFEKFLFL
jgi:hypothetical protein